MMMMMMTTSTTATVTHGQRQWAEIGELRASELIRFAFGARAACEPRQWWRRTCQLACVPQLGRRSKSATARDPSIWHTRALLSGPQQSRSQWPGERERPEVSWLHHLAAQLSTTS